MTLTQAASAHATTDTVRVAIYLRQSRDTLGTEAAVDRQDEDCQRTAARPRWKVTARHVDNDISAKGHRLRPGFEALLAAVERGEVDVIVAWALDRLTRNRRDTLRLLEACEAAGVTIALCRGADIDMTTPAGRLVADFLSSVAAHEIAQKSDRQKRQSDQAAARGAVPGRRAFGYNVDGAPHPVEAPVVRQLYTSLLAGMSMTSLTRRLNEDGHRSTTGKPWEHSGVRRLLLSPRYVNMRTLRGEVVGQGTWEPLVSEETWQAARALLLDPARRTTTGNVRRWLGSGVWSCGRCAAEGVVAVMASTQRGSKAKGPSRTYSCPAFHRVGRADDIDAYVRLVVAERLRRDDAADVLTVPEDGTDLGALRIEGHRLREREAALALDYAEGLLTGRQVQVATTSIHAKLAVVDAKLATAGRRSALAAALETPDPGQAFLDADLAQQKAIIRGLVRVTLTPGPIGRRGFHDDVVAIDDVRPSTPD